MDLLNLRKAYNVVTESLIGSCNCLTKTPVTSFHQKSCLFRKLTEAADAIAEAVTELDAVSSRKISEEKPLEEWGTYVDVLQKSVQSKYSNSCNHTHHGIAYFADALKRTPFNPSGIGNFKWSPGFSESMPNSVLLKVLTIHHSTGEAQYLWHKPTRLEKLSDQEIIDVAISTKTAEPGTDGYVLPVSFGRALEKSIQRKSGI